VVGVQTRANVALYHYQLGELDVAIEAAEAAIELVSSCRLVLSSRPVYLFSCRPILSNRCRARITLGNF
jgi:hypothetical protein